MLWETVSEGREIRGAGSRKYRDWRERNWRVKAEDIAGWRDWRRNLTLPGSPTQMFWSTHVIWIVRTYSLVLIHLFSPSFPLYALFVFALVLVFIHAYIQSYLLFLVYLHHQSLVDSYLPLSLSPSLFISVLCLFVLLPISWCSSLSPHRRLHTLHLASRGTVHTGR